MRWDGVTVGLDEPETRGCRTDVERAKGGLKSGSAGDEHQQARRRPNE